VELLDNIISLKENREGERSNSREVFGKKKVTATSMKV
jgi:hypothetical protein